MNATQPRMRARWVAALAAALTAASLLAVPNVGSQSAVSDGPISPRQWPRSFLAAPELEAWPNAVRMWGPDRHQTALAVSLTLRGKGGYPFDTPDATSGAGRSLGSADGWWGLGLCPRSIIVVASDVPADAVTAASLSDSTGRSSEPRLRRVAASDPLFDPIGGFARVDTFAAPILLTDSVRDGADSLNHAARLAAQDLRTGGCNAARQAIIVGGPAAVPVEIERELVSIGYDEVFRVSGETRYGTAAVVAQSLGTRSIPRSVSGCRDSSAADGNAVLAFYANSVVEWRERASRCELLGRTVVLAVGLDALAAGWWTSFWQVPVLLHDGSHELPEETAVALSLLDAENLIVLGDTTHVPESVAELAAQIAQAEMRRVAGDNRYETSVEMAKIFGGWWPTNVGDHFARSSVCLVALSDESPSAKGWPDALGAGAFCGAASAPSPDEIPYAVERLAGPVDASEPGLITVARRPAAAALSAASPRPKRAAVPMLLVPAGAGELPEPVEEFLRDVFVVGRLCSHAVGGINADGSGADDAGAYAAAANEGRCFAPGMVLAFGGEAVITSEVLAQASSLVSGGLVPSAAPEVPILVGASTPHHADPDRIEKAPDAKRGVGAFATRLPFDGTVFHRADAKGVISRTDRSSAVTNRDWICLPRGTYAGTRWLVAETSPDESPALEADLTVLGWYLADVDEVRRKPEPASPGCLAMEFSQTQSTYLRAVGPYGRTSRSAALVANANRRFRLTDVVEAAEPVTGGVPSDEPPSTGEDTRLAFRNRDPAVFAHLPPHREPVREAFVSLEIDRGFGAGRPHTFNARWSVETPAGTVSGIAEGEAKFVSNRWELRGMSVVRSGTWMRAEYGSHPDEPSEILAGAAVAGLADDGYGAGGFMATISVNEFGSDDDTIVWRVDAYINARP
ncbi:cell wall-binding repeat-containing protein [Candidatus Poriferisodalis sp.]|uniref:cell wall-binding repeat-containing protein n=1 Tax=Candidatus Poriferisodalis sp. TaxID=3101277 RepID=UPI003B01A7B4